jgi:predicted PolB exonuclease-like 3'-5' exonuclease
MNTLVFDIETVPDVELGRRLYDLDGFDDATVAHVMAFKQRQVRQSDMLPPHQQRVVAISGVMRSSEGVRVFSLGDEQSAERELVQRFFDGLERYTPTLVSWNGSGFDLPVLGYRALSHGLSAARYWEVGERDRDFRYNSYLSRYHWRHVDLMDVLSGYGASGRASLEHTAQLLRLPGKLGMSGADVWPTYLRGDLASIRNYCETDALNTYLIYLRFQLLRGELDAKQHVYELQQVEAKLEQSDRPHLREFLEAWRASRNVAG